MNRGMKKMGRALPMMARMLLAAEMLIGWQPALAQQATQVASRPPLVACEAGKTVPCVLPATSIADMAGVWKQYQSNPVFAPVGGTGYVRFSPDGTFALADTREHAALPEYSQFPHGTYSFEGSRMTITVLNPPPGMPECARSVQEVRVVRMGDQPVAMTFVPIEDTCKPRLSDTGQVQLYIGPVQ
ncbi:hypothetical protein [Deinococcus sp.]|uniref:hypothetical protein n=1 Tax=Deinococcus sp. TaxID=47478 RepID=UPI003C7AC924